MTPVKQREKRRTFRSSTNPDPADSTDQTWSVHSTDGLWSYYRLDGVPGTPWEVVYNPTGQNTLLGSEQAARRWTASNEAVPYFIQQARDIIDREGIDPSVTLVTTGLSAQDKAAQEIRYAEECRYRLRRACRWLLIHDGRMTPAGGQVLPESRCSCGGLLTYTAGQWRHIDACPECYDPANGWVLPCHDKMRLHVACLEVDPLSCLHICCARPMDLARQPCPTGKERCCGCCEEEP
jgi:hypothetical protein